MKGIYWLGLLGIASFQGFIINPCVAQSSNIIPDNSLGGESSQINENPQQLPPGFSKDKIETITGGAQRGINLFHSFQEFNVSEGRGAYFLSPNAEIQNILTRVTGRNPSEILGTLGTFGNSQPNFFLINPNGIVFGENASLDVGGSFVASTANGINLGETGFFSATEPEKSNLLSVNPSALFFNAVNTQAGIVNRSTATSTVFGSSLNGDANRPINGLQVLDGKSLLLVGGDVSLDGGRLFAPGGRVELGGLGEAGKVGLGINGDIFSLNFPQGVERGEISLTNESRVNTLAGGGGSIAVNARNMNVSGGSWIDTGIGAGLGTVDSQAGDITLNATGEVNVTDSGSRIGNNVQRGAEGNGGNITVDAGSFNLAQSAQLIASTFGKGNAGNVTVTAKDAISLIGNTAIFSTVEAGGTGKGGNIDMNAVTLTLRDGAQLQTITRGAFGTQPPGKGDAGNINLKVSGAVDISGKSRLRSEVGTGTEGNGGNITVEAGSFNLAQRALLSASTFGKGNAGNVTVTAKDAISLTNGGILSTVEAGGVGKGGNINMNAATLTLRDGAQLQTITGGEFENQPAGKGDAGNINLKVSGAVDIAGKKDFVSALASEVQKGTEGNGGNIRVEAGSFNLAQRALLSASSFGKGDAGNVTVTAKDAISLTDANILSTVEVGGVGKGGNIDMNAATLTLRDGAQLQTITRGAFGTQPPGKGDAGNINLKVSGAVDISGKSRLRSEVGTGTEGNGGNITVEAGSFNLAQRALLSASTFGKGNAGNVTVTAKDAISLTNGGILSTVEAGGVGKGGNIDINAATLTLRDGAQLATATDEASNTQPPGKGDAGNINLKVSGAVDIAGRDIFPSGLRSEVQTGAEGNGGNITVDAGSFNLGEGAVISASNFGKGNAGDVKVKAQDAIYLDNAYIFTVGARGVGKSGNIDINAPSLTLRDGAQLITSIAGVYDDDTQSAGKGDAGNININVTGIVDIAGEKNGLPSGISSDVGTAAEGNGGNITVNTGSFKLAQGAKLSASTFGKGDAGNVEVDAQDAIYLSDNSYIFSTVEAGGVGKGGNIDINAPSLTLRNGAQILTSTRGASDAQAPGKGDAGNVNVNVSGVVDITGKRDIFPSGIRSRVDTGAEGNGGNITVDAGSFKLGEGAVVTASTFGNGKAGNVTVTAKDAISLIYSAIFSTVGAGGVGKGGNIDINAPTLTLRDGAQILTSTRAASDTQSAGKGDAGNVNVNVSGAVDITGKRDTLPSGLRSNVETGTEGNGGNITIDAGSFNLGEGAVVNASTFGKGDAGNVKITAKDVISLTGGQTSIFSTVEAGGMGKGGNIDINAATFTLRDGAQLQTVTRGASDTQPPGKGDAGDVNVKVTGLVDIAGEKNGVVSSGIFSRMDIGTEGNAGNITIDSGSLKLRDGAGLAASTFGRDNAGTIKINVDDFVTISGKNDIFAAGLFVNSASTTGTAGDIIVDSPKVTLDGGTLNAQSTSGNGGNINIISDLLLMRRGAEISTNAGTAQQGGDGGNININSKFIVALPQENSDITANAFSGAGGNVNILSQGIFGIEPRQQQNDATSDITASSELGVPGVLNLTDPDDSNIRNNLDDLPENQIDTNALIANSCISRSTNRQENSFTITGPGGLRNSPGDGFISEYSTGDVRNVEPKSQVWKKGDVIIEPTGVYKLSDGRILLNRGCSS